MARPRKTITTITILPHPPPPTNPTNPTKRTTKRATKTTTKRATKAATKAPAARKPRPRALRPAAQHVAAAMVRKYHHVLASNGLPLPDADEEVQEQMEDFVALARGMLHRVVEGGEREEKRVWRGLLEDAGRAVSIVRSGWVGACDGEFVRRLGREGWGV